MELYKDMYITYLYEKENSLLIFKWTKEIVEMKSEKYWELLLKRVAYIKEYEIKYLIDNISEKTIVGTIEDKEWQGKLH